MAEFLYAAAFEGSLIKVGRSARPHRRVAEHEDRLIVAGVSLIAKHIAECRGSAKSAESVLIERCLAAAVERRKGEWFVGLRFSDVCAWMDLISAEVRDETRFDSKLLRWLDAESGRHAGLAAHLGLSKGRISQISRNGVPKRYLIAVREFTGGELSLDDLLEPPLGEPESADRAAA